VRHVGDRVAAVVAETLEEAIKARDLIEVEYEPLPAVFTVEEAMAEGAPLVHNGYVEYNAGAPDDLDEYNAKLSKDPREGKVIYQFPLHGDVQKNIAAANHGGIGDVDKAFAEADRITSFDYEYDVVRSEKAGYPIYFTTKEGVNEWISDLGNRLEVNLMNGKTVNIWIKDVAAEARKELVRLAQEMGYTAF
jgi:putative selenate reductase molybdopterin-binding subunit